jgi:carbonic anhydrase/acetyltransferase-like protein (isoleucine patch superfamily)
VNAAFVAPNATLIGKVSIGTDSMVWYGAVLRGDDNSITVGERVSIGDRVMVHCSSSDGHVEAPTVIGDGCVVQAGAILHGIHLFNICGCHV